VYMCVCVCGGGGIDSPGSGYGPVEGSRENGNETSVSIKGGEFVKQLRGYEKSRPFGLWRFRGTCCLHLQGEHCAASQPRRPRLESSPP
jgi:hypothetical protein